MHPASNKFSFPALDTCSDSLLLGVSAVNLDAPPGLISGSPTFPFFQTCIGYFHIFSKCLNYTSPLSTISWSILAGHSLCAAQFQHSLGILQYVRTCPKCSVASTLFLHVCHCPTHPFLLDCRCLLRAPCCCIPRTATTQIEELQIPSNVTFQTSHTACLHCTCWRQQQKFIGAIKLADKNSSHQPHVQLGSTLRMVSHLSNGTTSPV